MKSEKMYIYAFLLCFPKFTTIVGEASKTGRNWQADRYDEMWENDGGGRQQHVKWDSSPRPQSSRSKRQVIPTDKIPTKKYTPAEWFGSRAASVVQIRNKGDYGVYNLRYTVGVRLQSRMVLTPCSAVTYMINLEDRVTYNRHVPYHKKVNKVRKEDLSCHVYSTTKETARLPSSSVKDILIHPGCDNQYLVDFAVLILESPLLGSKNVWIHTPENLFFRRNLDRVVAAQSVLGKCTIPTFTRPAKSSRSPFYDVNFVPVNFQHWDGCRQNVCNYWKINTTEYVWKDPKRCKNLYNGTRYCIAWQAPVSMCHLASGVPIFCDVGNIHGLMGFFIRETYSCFGSVDQNGIMQGLNDALDWIYDTLLIRLTKNYDREIPEWVQNLRWDYSHGPFPPPIHFNRTTTERPDIAFENYDGLQVRSMVIVWHNNHARCLGTLVTHTMVVLPCTCVTLNNLDMTKGVNIKIPQAVEYYEDFSSSFAVSLMINGSKPRINAINFITSKECNTHAAVDLALIFIEKPVPYHKIAWIMTSHRQILKTLITMAAIADSSFSYDCYWMKRNPFPKSATSLQHTKVKIRFVHWTQCIVQTCPSGAWYFYQKDRCYGPNPPTFDQSTLFCFESTNPKYPACNLQHGTPIFCNNEAARGFIGMYTKAMDLDTTPCEERPLELRAGVFIGLDQFIDYIGPNLWITEMEQLGRDSASYSASSASTPNVSSILTFLVVTIIVYVVLKI